MPAYRRALDVRQGYGHKDTQTPVGFITRLSLGGTDFAADQVCKDPTSPASEWAVVAVLSGVLWDTGVTDAVYLSGQVSAANRQKFARMVLGELTRVDVTCAYSVFDYDPVAKRYFLGFHSDPGGLQGLLEKRGVELNLSVADDPSHEVQSPENYAFQVGIKPQPMAQVLHLATSVDERLRKAWGLAIP